MASDCVTRTHGLPIVRAQVDRHDARVETAASLRADAAPFFDGVKSARPESSWRRGRSSSRSRCRALGRTSESSVRRRPFQESMVDVREGPSPATARGRVCHSHVQPRGLERRGRPSRRFGTVPGREDERSFWKWPRGRRRSGRALSFQRRADRSARSVRGNSTTRTGRGRGARAPTRGSRTRPSWPPSGSDSPRAISTR